jgi:hypothetical protein
MIADSLIENPMLIPSLLGVVLFLQLVGFIVMLAMSGNVKRLMRWAASQESHPSSKDKELAELKEENSEQKHLFAEFLAEDPERRELPKKEQFAEFRRWRERKGLNWKG